MNEIKKDKAVELVDIKGETEEQERLGISLNIENVNYSYGSIHALQNISFNLKPGERIGIIGNGGSGKTTLCDIVSGLKKPTSGNVKIKEKNAKWKSATRRARMGLRRTFQTPVIFDYLSIEENVILGAPASKGDGIVSSLFIPRLFYKEKRDSARRILEYCHVDIEKAQKQKTMDFALKSRIELARALMGNPRLLVIDQPLTSMNEEESAQYCQVVFDYVETFSTTLIFAEHDIDAVRSLCKRIVALDAGELIADGESVAVLRNPEVMKRYLNRSAV